MATSTDVAIVGGGPAGAALAIRLATLGIDTTLIERRAAPTWHACGVFSSPLTRAHLAALGLARARIETLHRRIAALDLESTRGARCRIEYQAGPACGFDRLALESALLERAHSAGATVMTGTVVRGLALAENSRALSVVHVSEARGAREGARSTGARIVIGADGATSMVARAAGVYRTHRRFTQAGITFHRADPSAAAADVPMDGRFVFGNGWYVGIAPVPGARVNVGIVVPRIRDVRPADISRHVIESLPGAPPQWARSPTTDHLAVAGRLEHHAARAAGSSWLLVGDAIGFIDPLTGEGLLRALVSAELAADAIDAHFRGRQSALEDYDRSIRRRFYGKNVVSWMLQLFLARPEMLDYALRRLAQRRALRDDLTLVLTDQARPSRVLNPAFLARLLAP